MPQLDPAVFAPQLIWLGISFLVLYFLMARLALPRVSRVLQQRAERIEGNIEKAERLKNEAEEALKAYEAQIAKARAEAQALLQKAALEIAQESQMREAAFAERMKAESDAAEARIASAKSKAMVDVKSMAADLAQAIATKLTGNTTNHASAADAVAKAAAKVEA